MKIMEPFQEIPYTVKYAVLPSKSIENTMCPSKELIKKQNEENGFFTKLENSILKDGISNPIGIAAKKDKIYVTYGGSRLMIAQKHGIDIPCIIADFDNVFPEAKIITEEEVASYFKNPPTHFQLRTAKLYIHGCENTHLQENEIKLDYVVRYVEIPAKQIFNMCGPEHWAKQSQEIGWTEEEVLQNRIKERNKKDNFYNKLAGSILSQGFRNPILVTAGWCLPKNLQKLPLEMQENEEEILACFGNGGSRLWIAEKFNLTVPCIVSDFCNRFSDHKSLNTIEEITTYYKDPPEKIEFHRFGVNVFNLPQTQFKENQMVNVVCVKWGPKYGPEYVNILQAMVKRNLSLPHRFICFTDDNTGLNPNVETFPLTETDLEGWWHKVTLFKSDLFGLTGRTLYLDLDVVIIDSIDCFFNDYDDRFVIIKDWNSHANKLFWNSSVFLYDIGKLSFVWDTFSKEKARQLGGGDQIWITKQIPDATNWPDTWCRSFKYECVKDGVPGGCKIVIFHGQPNPPEALTGKVLAYPAAPWIADYWKE